MDQYSSIINTTLLTEKNGDLLGKIYSRVRRESEHTPNRTLGVTFDNRMGLDFDPVYSYLVRFNKKQNESIAPAGNHWHEHKQEFFVAASGDFRILLENTETKEVVEYILCSDARSADNKAIEEILYIPSLVAHAVHPLSDGASSLLVMASSPGAYGDTFSYNLTGPTPALEGV